MFRGGALINGIHVDVLAKVGLDAFYTHSQQMTKQLLVPLGSSGIGEVYRTCIVQSGEIAAVARLALGERSDVVVLPGFFQLDRKSVV